VIAGAAELARFSYLNSRNVSGRIYVVCNGTNFPTTGKVGVPLYSTATASLGPSGIRTLQIGDDKQLPFSLYADNIEAVLA
jgi:hypothetical protein